MLARTFTATMIGLEPVKIEIEVDGNQGQPALIIVGLPSKTVAESKDRITSALRNCGIRIRSKRTVVNLAPAEIKKNSSSFELGIAIGILKMYREIDLDTNSTLFLGELSLEGTIKPIKGALPLVLAAKKMGFTEVVLPEGNALEVSSIKDIKIFTLKHLKEYISFAQKNTPLTLLKRELFKVTSTLNSENDFNDIQGQEFAKRALTVAAAGGHNILLLGPPGSGKSILAKALTTILPPLTEEEAVEVTSIYSVAGLHTGSLLTLRPFRSPHHTTSVIGLIGGSSHLKPGEISLAHRGVLFLDEFPEFNRACIEALRQPLEEGKIAITRASGQSIFPAIITLVAAANPCPCGNYGSTTKACSCTPSLVSKYRERISGPIVDRIDLQVRVEEVPTNDLTASQTKKTSSQAIRKKVMAARARQLKRLVQTTYYSNNEIPSKELFKLCKFEPSATTLLKQATKKYHFSARSYFKIIRIAQTIADLEASTTIASRHIAEALQYRFEKNE